MSKSLFSTATSVLSTSHAGLISRLFKPLATVAVSLAAGAALAALAVFAAGPTTSMKLATVVWVGYGPFYVAESLDLFKEYNLKVSLQVFSDPALIPAAIASGAVDGGMLTFDQVFG